MIRKGLKFVAWLALTLMLINLVPSLTAHWLMFQPPTPVAAYQAPITLKTKSGLSVEAEMIRNPKAQYTLLYSHGNAVDLPRTKALREQLSLYGYHVFSYEYPGYGHSTGPSSEQNIYEAIDAAYEYLVKGQQVDPCKLIIVGRSIGTGPAVELASKQKARALLLISPMLSAYRVLTYWKFLLGDHFKSADKIANINMPLLIMHGESDWIIPIWHGYKLFSIAEEPKQAQWLSGYGHNDLFNALEFPAVIKRFTEGLELTPCG